MEEEKKIEKKKHELLKKALLIMVLLAELCVLYVVYIFLTLPDVEYLKTGNPKTSAIMEQRKKEAEELGKTLKIRQKWVSYNAIPQLLKNTVLTSEDASFYSHDGIDYYELKESIKKNLEKGKISRGGSTITQQLAKNLFLSTERSYFRKIKEFFIAKKLEKYLSKDRILYLYLNVIEFGNGIFGVEAASEFYFGKPVGSLSLSEIVRLVSVIPMPLKVTPVSGTRYLKWRARLLLTRIKAYHYISEEQYNDVITQFKR
jgi:monofunctional glycosyltransferase